MKNTRSGKAKYEQADGSSRTKHAGSYHVFLKKIKRRHERHKARRDPECIPAYNKYDGYET